MSGLQMSIGSLAGHAGVRCSCKPFIAAPEPVHAVCGPGTQRCPGAAFQSQIAPWGNTGIQLNLRAKLSSGT